MIHSPEMTKSKVLDEFSGTHTEGAFFIKDEDRADVISYIRPGKYVFSYHPGWHTMGDTIAENFDEFVGTFGPAHYGVHPLGQFSIDSQKEAWLNARKKDGYRPAKIYAQSMGVLTVAHAFSDPLFRYEFGEVDSICFDAPVSSRHDIRSPYRQLMMLGTYLPDNPIVEKLCRIGMELTLAKTPDFDSELLTIDVAKANSAASTRTRLKACVSQLIYMYTHDIADFDLHDFGKTVENKKIITSPYDNLVDDMRSAAIINDSFGGGFEHWVDPSRRMGDHATGTERPQGVIDMIFNRELTKYKRRRIVGKDEIVAQKGIRRYIGRRHIHNSGSVALKVV